MFCCPLVRLPKSVLFIFPNIHESLPALNLCLKRRRSRKFKTFPAGGV